LADQRWQGKKVNFLRICGSSVPCCIVDGKIYSSLSCLGRIRFDSCFLYLQNEIGPSISSSVVLCVFFFTVKYKDVNLLLWRIQNYILVWNCSWNHFWSAYKMGVIDQAHTQADLPQGKFFPLNWIFFRPQRSLKVLENGKLWLCRKSNHVSSVVLLQ
jgi:hypothetical protein